jgi:hypothetical protein
LVDMTSGDTSFAETNKDEADKDKE